MDFQALSPSHVLWPSPRNSSSACAIHSTQNVIDQQSHLEPEEIVHIPCQQVTSFGVETTTCNSMFAAAGYEAAAPSAAKLRLGAADSRVPTSSHLKFHHLAFGQQVPNVSPGFGVRIAEGCPGADGDVFNSADRDYSDACFSCSQSPTSQHLYGATTFHDLATNGLFRQSDSGSQESDGIWGLFPPSFSPVAEESSPALSHDPSLTPHLLPSHGDGSVVTTLRCPHPTCTSKVVFKRSCDLRKHYCLHFRNYSCRVPNCHIDNGKPRKFALRKDRDRHEKAHTPSIPCLYCDRLFTRQDNKRDHCRKRHHGALMVSRSAYEQCQSCNPCVTSGDE